MITIRGMRPAGHQAHRIVVLWPGERPVTSRRRTPIGSPLEGGGIAQLVIAGCGSVGLDPVR